MNNVAKIAVSQQQGAVLSQQLQEQKIVQQNLEKAVAVKKAADSEAKTQLVGDGTQGGSNDASSQQKKNNGGRDNPPPPAEKKQEIKESYLGQHIDVSR